jgi:hypothetical protein
LGVEADIIRLALHMPVSAPIVECAGVAIEGMRDHILALLAGVLPGNPVSSTIQALILPLFSMV